MLKLEKVFSFEDDVLPALPPLIPLRVRTPPPDDPSGIAPASSSAAAAAAQASANPQVC